MCIYIGIYFFSAFIIYYYRVVVFFSLLIFSSHTEKDSHDIYLENILKLLLHYTHIWDDFTHTHVYIAATHYRYIILLLNVCSHETDFGFDAERFSRAKCSNHSDRIVCPIVKSI